MYVSDGQKPRSDPGLFAEARRWPNEACVYQMRAAFFQTRRTTALEASLTSVQQNQITSSTACEQNEKSKQFLPLFGLTVRLVHLLRSNA
jgi:hypothetical protein